MKDNNNTNNISKESAIAKINKYGKIGKIITRIMMVFVILGAVSTLISAIAMKVMPNDIITLNLGTQAECIINPSATGENISIEDMNMLVDQINNGFIKGGLNLGTVSLQFDNAQVDGDKIVANAGGNTGKVELSNIGNALFFVVFSLILTFISILFGNKLCKAFEKCESPFEENVITRMRHFAFSLIPWALFAEIPEYAINSVFGNNLNTGFDLDMNVVFTVLIILALTIVFKYGAILQQESDETL